MPQLTLIREQWSRSMAGHGLTNATTMWSLWSIPPHGFPAAPWRRADATGTTLSRAAGARRPEAARPPDRKRSPGARRLLHHARPALQQRLRGVHVVPLGPQMGDRLGRVR